MARGGAREGAGRKPGVVLPKTADKHAAGRIIEAINKPETPEKKDSHEIQRWRGLVDAQDLRIRLDALKYLYDKRDGKATQPIDHGGSVEATIIWDMPGPERERKK